MELMLHAQKQAVDDLNRRMDTQLADLKDALLKEAAAAAAVAKTSTIVGESTNAEDATIQGSKKKQKKLKKKKNQPPPIEVRECIRKKRTLVKALKAEHLLKRQDFVTTLSRNERLVIQETS